MDQYDDSIYPDWINFGNGARNGAGAAGGIPGARIRGKGMVLGEECVSWNDISSNNSNGANSAEVSSMPSRSNLQSVGGLSGFSFSQQSQSQSNTEGLFLGPSSSSGIRVGDEHEDNKHDMQMRDNDEWDIRDDTGLS